METNEEKIVLIADIMKKIAYIELDTHAEIVNNFMDLMDGSEAFSVDYFLSPKVLKLVEHRREENIMISNAQILLDQLQSKHYDWIVIGTAHRFFNTFYKVTQLYPTSIITHNFNFIKRSPLFLFQAVFKQEFGFRIKLLLLEGLLMMPKVYQSAKKLLVLGNQFECKRKQYFPVFYNRFIQKSSNQKLQVVIPGIVSQQRRDYKKVLEKLKGFKTEMEIVLLGKAQSEELQWIQNVEKELPENICLKYFTKKISPEKFDVYMKTADVLWCPIQKKTIFFSGEEIYGKTKLSGNIGDAIKYGKPAVFPAEYSTNYPFIFSEDADIENQLISIAHETVDFSNYAQSEVLKRLENALLSLIETESGPQK